MKKRKLEHKNKKPRLPRDLWLHIFEFVTFTDVWNFSQSDEQVLRMIQSWPAGSIQFDIFGTNGCTDIVQGMQLKAHFLHIFMAGICYYCEHAEYCPAIISSPLQSLVTDALSIEQEQLYDDSKYFDFFSTVSYRTLYITVKNVDEFLDNNHQLISSPCTTKIELSVGYLREIRMNQVINALAVSKKRSKHWRAQALCQVELWNGCRKLHSFIL